ncbi:LysR family transcriptional regulator [Photobacterium sp. 1_MG-2023]|uniref:LysR family transcriptional regulator n=1 Tax=Photobacterium sp. 1_MG-2023 TaxID=3062646 RepID=UPI0026E28566|nr:LysR family transcriptional regulator [Photobacterium sp. 1_MG-2023]MDO6706934.1 LysR family transcriptional regulator [Photobacterium sp. 1_MG-2023]
MNWNLDQLEAFVTAAQTGSFTATARKLGKAQSRISTAIANLEADLGFALFDRAGKYPVLTEDGTAVLNDALSVLSQCERLQSRAFSVAASKPVQLTIAMDEAVPIENFETLYAGLALQFPNLSLTLLNGSQEDIARWIDEGRAELGFVLQDHPLPLSLERYAIVRTGQSLIVSDDHPLASFDAPTESQLIAYRQLVIRDRMGNAIGKPLSPSYWHVDSFYLISSLVMRGIGWAFVPEHVARADWYAVKTLSTQNLPYQPDFMLSAVKRRDSGWNDVLKWMLDEAQRLFREEGAR